MTTLQLTPPKRIIMTQIQQLIELPELPLEEQIHRLKTACQNLKTTRDAEYFLKLPVSTPTQRHARDRIMKFKKAHHLLMTAQQQAVSALEILQTL